MGAQGAMRRHERGGSSNPARAPKHVFDSKRNVSGSRIPPVLEIAADPGLVVAVLGSELTFQASLLVEDGHMSEYEDRRKEGNRPRDVDDEGNPNVHEGPGYIHGVPA